MGALEKSFFFFIVRYSFIMSIADEDGPYLHISIGYLESLCIYKIRVKSLCVFFFFFLGGDVLHIYSIAQVSAFF